MRCPITDGEYEMLTKSDTRSSDALRIGLVESSFTPGQCLSEHTQPLMNSQNTFKG